MKLLYLNALGHMGGAERALLDMLGLVHAARPGWPLGLLLGEDGPLAAEARRIGVQAIVSPLPPALARLGDHAAGRTRVGDEPASLDRIGRAIRRSLDLVSYTRRIRREVLAFGPDIMHTNGFKMHLLGACVRPMHVPLIWHFHEYLGPRPVTSRLVRQAKRRCTVIAANSASVAEDVRRRLGPRPSVVTIPNSVDFERFRPTGPSTDLDALAGLPSASHPTVRIGLVATFARWKGHVTFLEALGRLESQTPVRAYVVGGPLYRTEGSQYSLDELQGTVRRLGLTSAVGFTGFVDDPASAMRALDIVVHASTAPEPFGLVIAEAMTLGRAVVASFAGGATELITPERNGLAHEPGDVQGLARQLTRLVASEALRRQLGDAARQTALERFSPVRVRDQLLALYKPFARRAAA
jgi:glycosyltransferase involved in cell wall biosynthesis